MAKWKVVLTDRQFNSIDDERAILEAIGAELLDYQIQDEDSLIKLFKEVNPDAVIMQYANLSRRVIESMPNCQIIAKYAIGLDRIDIPAATENNVCVSNVRDYCIDEVSTHTVALILAITRKITVLNRETKLGNWSYKNMGSVRNLRGLTLGLNSFGKIAQLVAEKMAPYGINIIAYDPFVPADVAAAKGIKLVSFDELVEQSDILSTHVPDMDGTRGMFNKSVFKRMKNTSYLINTGRGPVVNELDLIEALKSGEIAGAALDVTDPEPIQPDNPLCSMNNVIITPHAAYYSDDSEKTLKILTAENVAQRLQGYAPRFLANPELKEKLSLKTLTE
ncbi:C-terminal binding protein [Clostridium aminobutyricum]|uniref:C-terminal binding protein n=1 Tax=Clostridium aminobutyricum TaxID=33953 RepID=A0A939DB89_CLOAM|nr:C-terminal binding protein [Clostridium aminobutyricum]MBN7774113.1 C-terminal binding protein [Clostridium aminobutyricum]